jgi:hypothetical protein
MLTLSLALPRETPVADYPHPLRLSPSSVVYLRILDPHPLGPALPVERFGLLRATY